MSEPRASQQWVADITYVRLQREFVYLAALLDAFSRRWCREAPDALNESPLRIGELTVKSTCQ
jgi:hypothetical protein